MNSRDPFPSMASQEPNPLRPYYIPPSIGLPPNTTLPTQSTLHTSNRQLPSVSPKSYLQDIDLGINADDLRASTSDAWRSTRLVLDGLAWRYASLVLGQPFEVTKILLQVADAGQVGPASTGAVGPGAKRRRLSPRRVSREARHRRSQEEMEEERKQRIFREGYGAEEAYDEEDEDDEDAAPDYFTSSAPRSVSPRKRRTRSFTPESSPSPPERQPAAEDPSQTCRLKLTRPDSVLKMLSEVWRTSGALGLWRATNCSFLLSLLQSTLNSFLKSLLTTLMGFPEPAIVLEPSLLAASLGTPDDATLTSILISVAASSIAALLLQPLDLVRTKLIISPTSASPRGLLANLRRLPSLVSPSSLALPTVLLHTLPQLCSASMPLALRRATGMTPSRAPNAWAIAGFGTALSELFVRLPLETVYRRAQVQHLLHLEQELRTVVPVARYEGIMGTVTGIVWREGVRPEISTTAGKVVRREKKGQGMAGLVRGWRIGFWGLTGVFAAGALGSGAGGRDGAF